jgi:hypothetical protein
MLRAQPNGAHMLLGPGLSTVPRDQAKRRRASLLPNPTFFMQWNDTALDDRPTVAVCPHRLLAIHHPVARGPQEDRLLCDGSASFPHAIHNAPKGYNFIHIGNGDSQLR